MAGDILVVDDEAGIRDLVCDILKDEGFATRVAGDSNTALKSIAERVPTLLILDIWLQGSELDGLGILELVQKKYPGLPVIMISGHGNIETAVSAIKIGAYEFIEKPFKAERLVLTAKRAIENTRLKIENSELKLRGGPESSIIGSSLLVNQIRSTVEKVAPTHSRILITGAPGTGKEVVARLIHARSKRAGAAFETINAASISPERFESELFGTEDSNPVGGAEKVGVLERAHGGTLFVDEISDMPMETQGRFLRVLQEQAFERVRGNKRVTVDVRVIAASNKDLQGEIDAGRFREDLYYRLNVVPIKMPSLKERREDIPELCRYFLKRASDTSGMPPRELTDDATAILQAYHWPGNVRQLRNMMEWLLIMAPGGSKQPVKADMLPTEMFESNPVVTRPEMNADIMSMPLRDARELFEKQYLAAQINRFNGNISKTSNFVGMERSALHRKLKMLGIDKEEKAA
jgi:two-component system nitrogen regulation response regulator NtrX